MDNPHPQHKFLPTFSTTSHTQTCGWRRNRPTSLSPQTQTELSCVLPPPLPDWSVKPFSRELRLRAFRKGTSSALASEDLEEGHTVEGANFGKSIGAPFLPPVDGIYSIFFSFLRLRRHSVQDVVRSSRPCNSQARRQEESGILLRFRCRQLCIRLGPSHETSPNTPGSLPGYELQPL